MDAFIIMSDVTSLTLGKMVQQKSTTIWNLWLCSPLMTSKTSIFEDVFGLETMVIVQHCSNFGCVCLKTEYL